MRKFLAGKLIRLAHRIYPPRVTEQQYTDFAHHAPGPYVYGGGEADGLSYMAAVESTLLAQNRFLDEVGHERPSWIPPFLEVFASGGQVRDMGPYPQISPGWNG